MSQKKVDAYKESKKSRKEEVQKEKRTKKVRAVIGWIILVLVVGGLITGIVFTVKNCVSETGDGYTVTEQVIEDLVDIEGTGTEEESEEETEEESGEPSEEESESPSAEEDAASEEENAEEGDESKAE